MRQVKNAFTMIELVFVIVIIGILATVAIPKFMGTQENATEANVKRQIQSIRASIEAERMQRVQQGGMENNASTSGTLTLYYDFQPWEGERYTSGKSAVLMRNVGTFQFKAVGDLLKIQLCVRDANISHDGGYSICKEKTIF